MTSEAIVIGVNNYEFLQPLQYAQQDALAVKTFLEQEARFDRVYYFAEDAPAVNGVAMKPTRNNLRRVMRDTFARPFMGDGDNFWFFFSGHGMRHGERDFLMPIDGDPDDITESGIATAQISEWLRGCGADNVVMILDACRSGGRKDGKGIGDETRDGCRQTGVISLFSCSPNQFSYELPRYGQGAFTKVLLEGLGVQGGCATVARLDAYLQRRVPEVVRECLGERVQQLPYAIAEPISKSHLILMPTHARPEDLNALKMDALWAEKRGDLRLALQCWLRVNVASRGLDPDFHDAVFELRLKLRQSTPSPSPQPQPTSEVPLIKGDLGGSPRQTQPIADASPNVVIPPSPSSKGGNRKVEEEPLMSSEVPLTKGDLGGSPPKTQPIADASPNVVIPSSPPSKGEDRKVEAATTTLPTFKFEYATLGIESGLFKHNIKIQKHSGTVPYYRETINNGVALDLVQIRGGTFDMGSNEHDREKPIHRVTVRDFFMGKYPVTQAQWKAVAHLQQQQRELNPDPSRFKWDDRPVERVSWDDAVEFCDRLTAHTGKHYRLPSEAEWEYACRAGTTTPFHFGETIDAAISNYDATSTYGQGKKGEYRKQTTPVGSFPANAWGLFDCHGNVREWCEDNWHDNYQDAPSDGTAWLAGGNTEYKIRRGGSLNTPPVDCRSADRSSNTRGNRYSGCGFRVVLCGVGGSPSTLHFQSRAMGMV